MTITITLFHGPAGWAIALLAALAAAHIANGLAGWLGERFTLELDRAQRWPAGRTVRRLHFGRRWDRPGAAVDMENGSAGTILYVIRDSDPMADVALVQAHNGAVSYQPEWVTTDRLSPRGHDEPADAEIEAALAEEEQRYEDYWDGGSEYRVAQYEEQLAPNCTLCGQLLRLRDHDGMDHVDCAAEADEDVPFASGPACDACGIRASVSDPLTLADDGRTVHYSHTTDPDHAYYDRRAPAALAYAPESTTGISI